MPEVGEIIEAQARGVLWERVSVLRVDPGRDIVTVMWPPKGYDPKGEPAARHPDVPEMEVGISRCRPDATPDL
jgi:hypothetical protein